MKRELELGSKHDNCDSRPDREKWAKIWFEKLARFHDIEAPSKWTFDCDHVISFLRANRDRGMPAWKRLKITENLIHYRNRWFRSDEPVLEPVRAKLRELAAAERVEAFQSKMIDAVGKIDTREPEVMQAFRIKLRRLGHKYSTEKAYIKHIRRFIQTRGVSRCEEFTSVTVKDVESFLTDIAIDGNVAPSSCALSISSLTRENSLLGREWPKNGFFAHCYSVLSSGWCNRFMSR
ncbi:MAG: phage integrase N-terminal SAM-like domain-containing protein [Planctomycetota bacterium]